MSVYDIVLDCDRAWQVGLNYGTRPEVLGPGPQHMGTSLFGRLTDFRTAANLKEQKPFP